MNTIIKDMVKAPKVLVQAYVEVYKVIKETGDFYVKHFFQGFSISLVTFLFCYILLPNIFSDPLNVYFATLLLSPLTGGMYIIRWKNNIEPNIMPKLQ